MTSLDEFRSVNREQLERLVEGLANDGVRFAQLQMPIFTGVLRTKLAPLADALGMSGEGFNTGLYVIAHGEGEPDGDVVFESPTVGAHNGWPNITAMADPDTVVRLDWHADTAAVLIKTFAADGAPSGLDVRAMLARLEDRAADLGFVTKLAFEFECFMFEIDREAIGAGRIEALVPYGRHLGVYDGLRDPGFEELCRTFMVRMESLGCGVAAMHTEYGHGMVEFALEPAPALRAADAAVRAKLCLREIAEANGLAVTFMARCRPVGVESAAGAHVHQSLWCDGENAFFDPAAGGGMSETARRYVAGILATLPELHLIYRPTLNSYRRFDRNAWAPEDASWGIENRYCAVRAIPQPTPDGVRFENRVAGADANPYLVVAASVGAGLYGIEEELEPPEPCVGDPFEANRYELLPRDFPESISRFEESKLAREILGAEMADHYVASRKAELSAYRHWLDSRVTDFEYLRYFESH